MARDLLPFDMNAGLTVTWTDKAGADHDAQIIARADRRLQQVKLLDDLNSFVAELKDGSMIYVRAERSRLPLPVPPRKV